MDSFKVSGPLPRGTTLLEASAGTGKTFTIAALTARYVAEDDLPIDRLLVMTFTRMATGELRERVRDRLVRAFDGLADVLAGRQPPQGDDIVRLLADVPRAEQQRRCNRLGKAIADFDAATIETTHGFCLQVLYGLGTAGDVDRDVTLVEDVRDLTDEVVDDLYLRKFAHRQNTIAFSREEAGKVARKVLDIPDAFVVPPLAGGDELEPTRRRFAERVRKEMETRKRALNILTYDDVLLRLRDTLRDPSRGALARARLRERFDVVLVDEFQDTDPVQWDIMRGAFDADGKTLVLIGDPKQAIYAFRGADVDTYLKAKATVQSKWTLDVNWRSDEGLLDAYDALFEGAQLGQAGITYRKVNAASGNVEPRLSGAPVAAPLRVRVVHTADRLVPVYQQMVNKGAVRDLIARDLALQTVELLESASGDHDASSPRHGVPPAAPGRHRRVGQVQQPGDDGVRRSPERARAGGHQRGRVRVRIEAGRGMAALVGGDRAARVERPRIHGSHDPVHRLVGGAGGGQGGRGALGGSARTAAHVGSRLARQGGRHPLRVGHQCRRRPGSGPASACG